MTAACVFAACYSQHAHDTGAGSSMLSASCRPVLALPLATTVGHDCLSRLAENTCKYNKAGMTLSTPTPFLLPHQPLPSHHPPLPTTITNIPHCMPGVVLLPAPSHTHRAGRWRVVLLLQVMATSARQPQCVCVRHV